MLAYLSIWRRECHHLVALGLVGVLVFAASGCGGRSGKGPKTAPVSGTITLDGKPLEGATVYFVNGTFTGFGVTNGSGRYELTRGALPGANKVFLSKVEGGEQADSDPEAGMDMEQLKAAAAASVGTRGGPKVELPKELVPPDYSSLEKSKLTIDVPKEGVSDADFRL